MAHVIDVYVGSRARKLRAMRGLSQAQLAKKLDLSFQQVQKYETGANRISARRLYELSKVFSVAPGYFYEGLDKTDDAATEATDLKAVKIAGLLEKITDTDAKNCLYDLIKVMAEKERAMEDEQEVGDQPISSPADGTQ
jgi:transcriptional regulator with XRE-family HTH domain